MTAIRTATVVGMTLAAVALGRVTLASEEVPQRVPVPAATPAELSSLIGTGKWVIVEFGGEHCIPCRAMQPILETLRDTFGDKVVVRNFWIQEHPDVARAHRIMVMPTQVVFDPKGAEVLRHIGTYSLEEFRAALAEKGLT
jgi:thiol-disulfide isomerase/thioredoxin